MLREKRRLVIKLRKQGKSYREIREKIKVSKSTLSLWLRGYPLTPKQIESLTKRYRTRQIEKHIETARKTRGLRLLKTYKKEQNNLLPLTKKELMIAGLFLYLGEGSKGRCSILVSNTNPNIVKFVLYWYTKVLKIPKEKIKVALQLYKDMNTKQEMNYWSGLLNIPLSNFWKPYIKKSTTRDIDHSGYKHGTCGLCYYNTRLHEKILMGMECVLDNINKKKV